MEYSIDKKIFLTGTTGVLGAHLLKTLLSQTQSHIYCLVRADDQPSAEVRLFKMLEAYGISDDEFKNFRPRLSLLLGDVASKNLGLSDREYDDLVGTVDFTIHAAASTNLFLKFSKIEPINITGVKNIIEFSLLTPAKKLCYVSTYTVLGDRIFDGRFIFKEEHLDVGQDFPFMTYQESKFIAEKLVRDARAFGLKDIIVRPGQIFGESTTGYYPQGQTNVSGLFMDIFKTVIETGVAIKSVSQFDITPVDYVSRSLIYLALIKEYFGGTFHLMNPNVTPYSDIIEIVRDIGYEVDFVSEDEYKKLLMEKNLYYKNSQTICNSSTTKAFRWWFNRKGFSFSKSATVDSTYTAKILKEAKIECPKIDRELLSTYIKHNVKTGYFPQI